MAKHISNNMKELRNMVEQQLIIKWMQNLSIKLPEYLKEFIMSEYYGQYVPSEYYERHYRIIDAITVTSIKKIGNTYEMSIYLDPSKVSYDPAVWYDKKNNSWNYIKGTPSKDVFDLIAQGIHGSPEFGQTDGRFWDSFLDSVGHGGIYDLFEEFEKYLNGKGLLSLIY